MHYYKKNQLISAMPFKINLTWIILDIFGTIAYEIEKAQFKSQKYKNVNFHKKAGKA